MSLFRSLTIQSPPTSLSTLRLPEILTVETPKRKVIFFTGSSINYFYPEVGIDIAEVLKQNDVETCIPKDQNCCGLAIFARGDVETARTLAKNNLDAFSKSGADCVITGCGAAAAEP